MINDRQHIIQAYTNSLEPHSHTEHILPQVVMSVIVPVYNEESTVGTLLHHLERQSHHNFEVILVDNGSTDNTRKMIEEFRSKSSLPILLIAEPQPGPGHARKQGMDTAIQRLNLTPERINKPYYLVTTDCDARPHPGWIGSFLRHQQQGFTGLLSGGHSGSRQLDELIEHTYDISDFFQSIAQMHVAQSITHSPNMKLSGPNCAFDIEAYAAAGGITQPIRPDGSCGIKEVQDLAQRCYILGYTARQTGCIIETSRRRHLYELLHSLDFSYSPDPTDQRRFLSVRDTEEELLAEVLKLPRDTWLRYHNTALNRIAANYV